MTINIVPKRQQLAYREVQEFTGWPHNMIEDYLGLDSINQEFQVVINGLDVTSASLQNSVSTNTANIAGILSDVAILQNDTQINKLSIDDALQLIADLAAQNAQLKARLHAMTSQFNDLEQLHYAH